MSSDSKARQRQEAPGRPHHGRWGCPAWSWPHPSCARAKDPRRGTHSPVKSSFPQPNSRTPHMGCAIGLSNSTTLKLSPSLPTSPHTGGHTIFWGTARGQWCPRTAPSALCPPKAATPLRGPITPHPSFSRRPPHDCWTSALCLSLGCPTTHVPAQEAARAGSFVSLSRALQGPRQLLTGLMSLLATTRCVSPLLPAQHPEPSPAGVTPKGHQNNFAERLQLMRASLHQSAQ